MTHKASILFLTDTLNSGGAERQLTELALRLDRSKFEPSVLYYAGGDFYRAKLEAGGVRVYDVARQGRLDFRPVLKLADLLRTGEVDLIHAFADAPNLYGAIAKRLAGRGKVIASVRSASDMGRSALQWRVKNWAHRTTDLTISNNQAGLERVAEKAKLNASQIICIRNGLDLTHFHPASVDERKAARHTLGISPDDVVFLSIGTLYWRKNYRGYIDALSQIDVPVNWKFIWVGRSPDAPLLEYLEQQISRLGLQQNFILLREPIEEVRTLYHASDVFVSNSLSEGTPNVVIEAMACGLPVIATDVGDSAVFATDATGWLIPPDDQAALASALCGAGAIGRDRWLEMGQHGRRRIIDLGMEMESVVKSHEQIYLNVLGR